MPSIIRKAVLSEPSGRRHASVLFAGSLALLSVYIYYGVLGDSPSVAALFLSAGAALSGLAESLPNDWRRTAGAFRATAILLLVALIASAILAPELVVGPR